jgi:recombination associated protein RdgC
MWFKNLHLYQFSEKFDADPERLATELANARFFPCSSIMPISMGWVAPIGNSEDAPLVHHANGFSLLSLKIEEKIIPPAVVREQLNEKIKVLEAEHQRKISSKEKSAIRDDIYSTLLPRAFTKSETITAYIDAKEKLFVINASSRTKAENFVSFLRKTLGSFPATLPETLELSYLMTQWLTTRHLPKNFMIDNSCVLFDKQMSSDVIRCVNHDILSPNVQNFLKDGMQVAQLKIQWRELLTFYLKEDLSINQLKFSDKIHEQLGEVDTDNEAQRLDTTFFLMTETLRDFLKDLLESIKK